jgi:hypothetical protein
MHEPTSLQAAHLAAASPPAPVLVFSPRSVAWRTAAAALVVGLGAALFYARAGLTLAHYDARGHLVVARRIVDSLTPGWQQIGAVWLPLPHLLNAVPVQHDLMYRTGASAVALSILALAAGVGAAGAFVAAATGSRAAGAAAAALVVLNPNLLYLQSTPMTEPLLLGLLLGSLPALHGWMTAGRAADRRRHARAAGLLLALACLTRYEAWPVTGAALGLATIVRLWVGGGMRATMRELAVAARAPAVAVLAFLLLSRVTVGRWFVSDGFFVPDNPALGDPFRAAGQVAAGAVLLGGIPLVAAGVAGIVVALARARRRGGDAGALPALPLFAAASLPWLAFLQGHPFRVRYMVALVAALAVTTGLAIGALPRRGRGAAAIALVAASAIACPPLDLSAPMVREAQLDAANRRGRLAVTEYLRAHRDGRPILASMASLGHYMHETAAAGFALKDFLHEGNGELWPAALERPAAHVGWILIEERAEGGDLLAARVRADAAFLSGFVRVAEGGGVALYRRRQGPGSPREALGLAAQ